MNFSINDGIKTLVEKCYGPGKSSSRIVKISLEILMNIFEKAENKVFLESLALVLNSKNQKVFFFYCC